MPVSRWLALALFSSTCAAGCGGSAATETAAPQTAPAAETHGGEPAAVATPTEAALKESEKKTSTDPDVNKDAAAIAEFKIRVDAYADLHQRLAKGDAKPKETADPGKINATKDALSAKIQAARASAKQGDVFMPAIRPVFRRLLAPELKGEDGRDAKAILKDDAPAPGTVPFKVNAKYPGNQPIPTVPANVLLSLPTLPAPLEYRIVGQHLLILDTAADLVVDYLLNIVAT
jgi:hypothetical protein